VNVQGLSERDIQAVSLQVGSSGNKQVLSQFGACTPSFSSADSIASSTQVGICKISGFVTSDKVVATQKLLTATGLTYRGFPVAGILATTSGQFGVITSNETGAATTSVNSVYRRINYVIVR